MLFFPLFLKELDFKGSLALVPVNGGLSKVLSYPYFGLMGASCSVGSRSGLSEFSGAGIGMGLVVRSYQWAEKGSQPMLASRDFITPPVSSPLGPTGRLRFSLSLCCKSIFFPATCSPLFLSSIFRSPTLIPNSIVAGIFCGTAAAGAGGATIYVVATIVGRMGSL